jgi:hypothetical protein
MSCGAARATPDSKRKPTIKSLGEIARAISVWKNAGRIIGGDMRSPQVQLPDSIPVVRIWMRNQNQLESRHNEK